MVSARRLSLSLLLLLVRIPAVLTQSDDTASELDERMIQLRMYLIRNGYLAQTDATEQGLIQAIIDLQTLLGLEPTGEADDVLFEIINVPRCGMSDIVPEDYRTSTVKYNTNRITYRIDRFLSTMDDDDVRAIIWDAFQVWADVTPLTFTEVFGQTNAHIVILFDSLYHGDGAPFDGPGGILAHAFLPLIGDAHFDADETWTIGTFAGTNLFQVAAHEFGHSLGLYHSDDISALMYPFYRGYQANFQLGEDDIEGIRSLYGSGSPAPDGGDEGGTDGGNEGDNGVSTTPTTPSEPQPPPPGACLRNGTFGAVVNTMNGRTYGFIGAYVWRLDVFPRTYSRVKETWPNLPNFVQSAVKVGNTTYILKRCFAWRYENQEYMGRIRIREQWPGLPCNVQAGYLSPSDGFTYFFKGSFVYRFQGSTLSFRQRIWRLGWGSLPARNLRITAANPNFDSSGQVINVYMFTGNIYYLFDDAQKRFIYLRHYPREVNRFILNDCPSS